MRITRIAPDVLSESEGNQVCGVIKNGSQEKDSNRDGVIIDLLCQS